MPNAAQHVSSGASYRVLRELGARSQRTYAAVREPHELVVLQSFVRASAPEHADASATRIDAAAMTVLLRDAHCLAKNWHPNIARVRHVDLIGSRLTIASELLDGATLADLLHAAATHPNARLPLPITLRIVLDLLAGLHALHGLRDARGEALGIVHGAVCPTNIVVGKDGVTRIINVLRARPVRVTTRSEAAQHAAPELLGTGASGPRSDLHAVGAVLREAIGSALPARDASPPFTKLADVARRALAASPDARFASAAEMAAELRALPPDAIASGTAVADHVVSLLGSELRARKASLDPAIPSHIASEARPISAPPSSSPLVQQSGIVRASPRVGAPTVQVEVPVALIAATRRPSLPDGSSIDIDDDEFPGPRGSSPEIDLQATIEDALASSLLAASEGRLVPAPPPARWATPPAASPPSPPSFDRAPRDPRVDHDHANERAPKSPTGVVRGRTPEAWSPGGAVPAPRPARRTPKPAEREVAQPSTPCPHPAPSSHLVVPRASHASRASAPTDDLPFGSRRRRIATVIAVLSMLVLLGMTLLATRM